MRLGSARTARGVVPVVEDGGGLRPLAVADGTGMRELIAAGPDAVARAARDRGEPLADAVLTAPLRPGKTVAIGLNYRDHAAEARVQLAGVAAGVRQVPEQRDRAGRADPA